MSISSYLAQDLAGVFLYDISRTAIIISNGISTTYTVLLNDMSEDEIDDFGGPMINMGQIVHFLAADLPGIEPGDTIYIQDLDEQGKIGDKVNRKKIVISTTISADSNELIVRVRGA